MQLVDRLDAALARRNLLSAVAEEPQSALPEVMEFSEVVEPPPQRQISSNGLCEDLDHVDVEQIEPDELGIRVARVQKIGFEWSQLPMDYSGYIINDIQKLPDGYEIHIVE